MSDSELHPSKAETFEEGNRPVDPAPPLPPAVVQKLDEIRSILDRMLVLAQTSANPDTADAEREALQQELNRLRDEIDAIADGLP